MQVGYSGDSRESGNPDLEANHLDSRLRENDEANKITKSMMLKINLGFLADHYSDMSSFASISTQNQGHHAEHSDKLHQDHLDFMSSRQ
jgi:hypothetical protein